MSSQYKPLAVLVLTLSLLVSACGDDEESNTNVGPNPNNSAANNADPNNSDPNNSDPNNADPNNADPNNSANETRTASLSFEGLPVLGEAFVYEGWLILEDGPVSTGRFIIEEAGTPGALEFDVPAAVADVAATFVLTIEPAEGDDPAPADTHVLAGQITDGVATLEIGHPAALGDDFQSAAGDFILATPTTAAPVPDENQGVWFLTIGDDGPEAGLELPELPAGWAYEGWVVDTSGENPVPISTGTFLSAEGADSDGPGATAGPAGAPPFPGQDFIDPARDLTRDHMVVISVEPSPDNSPMPFQLKPLASPIGPDSPQELNNVIADNNISGDVALALAETRALNLDFAGLPALSPAFVYEGWIIVEGAPVSTGRFTVDAEGVPSQSSFEVPTAQAEAATTFILTIEPAEDDDPAPADTHVLAGDFGEGEASLSIGHGAALGDDLSSAAGDFILATPTSEPEDDNNQGIWFLRMGELGPEPALTLPTLPDGWAYEGWVVDISGDNPMPISTGTFLTAAGADSDGAGATAGPLGAPPFPGQDFIDPARDLTLNHMAVISIEPSPDDSPMPFQLKPLALPIGPDSPQSLNNVIADNNISGGASWGDSEGLQVQMGHEGLPDLGADFVYEGWLIVDGAPVSSGRFSINEDAPQAPSFIVDAEQAEAATTFVLTIEPAEGDDPAPADPPVLAGDFNEGAATLSLEHPGALGTDFSEASGSFILATPTTPEPTSDENQGVWFLNVGEDGPEASLELPELPAGWAYEGWVVDLSGDNPMPISTGTFLSAEGADSDGGGAAAGPDGAPPFPGQDFIDPARDLTMDHMVVISIEPSPDDSPMPFQLKPLARMIEDSVGPENAQSLDNVLNDNNITGVLELK